MRPSPIHLSCSQLALSKIDALTGCEEENVEDFIEVWLEFELIGDVEFVGEMDGGVEVGVEVCVPGGIINHIEKAFFANL